MAVPTIWPIEQFEKDFEVLNKISEGSYGEVYKARATPTRISKLFPSAALSSANDGEDVAVKFLPALRAIEKLRPRQEIEILSDLNHQNILRLLGAYEASDLFIQVFEFLSGGELFEHLMNTDFALQESQINGFVKQICSGCAYLADNQIVHLDLKPQNIVFAEKTHSLLKIIDFGFARKLTPGEQVRAGQGTPEFVSPEVVACEPVSLTTDLWSVGVLAYILLSGLSPFLGDDVQTTYQNICSCNYTFEEDQFDEVSFSARDFISRLLVVDQDLRMSATEALNHPWLIRVGDLKENSLTKTTHQTSFKKTARRLSRHKQID